MNLAHITALKKSVLISSLLAAAITSNSALGTELDKQAFQNTILIEHNGYRNRHENTATLNYSATLAADAQAWAEHLLSIGRLEHESGNNDGESLFYKRQPLPYDPPLTPEQIAYFQQVIPGWQPPGPVTGESVAADAAAAWYNERYNYSYTTTESTNGNPVGHFTQMIWRSTTQLGCGVASQLVQDDTMIESYTVCRYREAGNQSGYSSQRYQIYTDNVMEPKPGA